MPFEQGEAIPFVQPDAPVCAFYLAIAGGGGPVNLVLLGGMSMPTYRYTYNDAYFTDMMERFRAQRHKRAMRIPLKIACGVGLIGLIALTVYVKAIFPTIALTF